MFIFRLLSDWQLLKAVFTSFSNTHNIEFLFAIQIELKNLYASRLIVCIVKYVGIERQDLAPAT